MVTLFLLCSCSATSTRNKSVALQRYQPETPARVQLLNRARDQAASGLDSFRRGDFRGALRSYHSALSNLILIDNYREMARLHHNIATIHIHTEKWAQARTHLDRADRLCHRFDLKTELAVGYNRRGLYHENRTQWNKALTNYKKALTLFLKQSGSSTSVANQYTAIGYVLLRTGRLAQAREAFRRSLRINLAHKDYARIAENFTLMGRCYYQAGDYQNALTAFRNAFSADKAIENSRGIAADLKDMGRAQEALGSYRKALGLYQRAARINSTLNLPGRVRKDLDNLIRMHRRLGNTKQVKQLLSYRKRLQGSLDK